MQIKTYKITEEAPMTVSEPAVAYSRDAARHVSTSEKWNPNVPFHYTQEEFLEHIHCIEQGEFFPVEEVHQRVSKWIYNQKR